MKKKIFIGIIIAIMILMGGAFFYLYQYTEVFGDKLIPVNINKVSIYYVPGYSLDEANLLNIEKEVVKKQEIKLSSEERKEIIKYFRKIKGKEKQSKKNNKKLYEININNTILEISEKDGLVTRKNKKNAVKISQDLYNYIEELINKDQQELVKKYEFEEASFLYNKTTINIKNNVKLIKDQLVFYPIEIEEDYNNYNNGYEMSLTIDQKLHVYLYNNKIAYIVDQRGETEDKYYAICVNRLYEILYKIYEKSTN